MSTIPWEHESSLLRMTGSGEEVVRRDALHQLVGHFLELPPERRRGLSIRASGPDWTREFDEWTIPELAARPEYESAYGRNDSDPEGPDFSGVPDERLAEALDSAVGRG